MDTTHDTIDPATAGSPRSMNYPSPKARRFRESHHLIPTPGVKPTARTTFASLSQRQLHCPPSYSNSYGSMSIFDYHLLALPSLAKQKKRVRLKQEQRLARQTWQVGIVLGTRLSV